MIDVLAAHAASALVSAVWQGTVLVVCIALCLRMVPRITAALRSLIWSVVFSAVCVLHFLPAPQQENTTTHVIHVAAQWSLALVILWLGSSLFRTVQLAVGLCHLRRVVRRATPIALPLQPPAASRAYQVCESPDVDRPCVLGFFSPRILLPPGLSQALTTAELNQVLLHEVEHLRRADDWTNLAQRLALILFPLNPVLFWVQSRTCAEREQACDDAVVSTTGARKAYALCLTQLAERTIMQRGLALALGAWQRKSELASRVHRILSRPERRLHPMALRGLAGSIGGAAALGFVMLARSPQLVTFMPASSPTRTASNSRGSILPAPHAVFTDAAFHITHQGPLLPAVSPVRSARSRTHAHARPGKNIRSAELRSTRVSQPDLLLTTSSVKTPAQYYVPTVILTPVAYAAVATSDGWIIIQL